jgi:hypothetical protein
VNHAGAVGRTIDLKRAGSAAPRANGQCAAHCRSTVKYPFVRQSGFIIMTTTATSTAAASNTGSRFRIHAS